MTVIDLFAGGARGWCYAARELGLDPLGIELDDAACRVSRAAGFPTLQGDVNALNPRDFAPCTGLVGSPPCPAFSMAGKGVGRAAIPFLTEAITRMAHGETIDRGELDEACEDVTAHLVLEPLRWVLALRPRWVALEQVEPVLPLWEAMAAALRLHGYQAWCGVVSAETFGTPQTRRRAILVASLDGPVAAPVATHQRYVAPRRSGRSAGQRRNSGPGAERDPRPFDEPSFTIRSAGSGSHPAGVEWVDEQAEPGEPMGLFELPEPERIVVPEDRGLRPWVSMAQALGWGMTARPSVSVVAGANRTGGPSPLDGGSGARLTLAEAQDAGQWEWITNTGTHATRRPLDEPAPTITGGASAAHDRYWRLRANANANASVRDVDEPAPTITAGHDSGDRVWLRAGTNAHDTSRPADEPAPTIRFGGRTNTVSWVPTRSDGRQSEEAGVVPRAVEDPASTVCASKLAKGVDVWTGERPATTINGDERCFGPHAGSAGESQSANAVRVSIEEAAILQGLPPGHPWMEAGSKSAAYRCVGNAIPPQMALAALLAAGAGRGDA